jgi:hypothetical protein
MTGTVPYRADAREQLLFGERQRRARGDRPLGQGLTRD